MIAQQPKGINICSLEVVLMPNGEIISLGKTLGWFKMYKDFLTVISEVSK
jgi:hypothetical protein